MSDVSRQLIEMSHTGEIGMVMVRGSNELTEVTSPLNKLLTVVEPAQVSQNKRFTSGDAVAFTIRGFSGDGKPTTLGSSTSIETAGSGTGKWLGTLDCSNGTSCVRQWMPPFEGDGEVAFVVSVAGKELRIRPKVRYSHAMPGG